MKKYTKYFVSLVFIFILPSFVGTLGAAEAGDWGVTEESTIYYTAGVDFEINLPDVIWDELNITLWNAINSEFGHNNSVAATFDARGIIEGLMDLPKIVNFEVDITGMESYREEYSELFDDDYWIDYDAFNVTIKAKLPTETTYLPIENFTLNYAENVIIPFIDDTFPTVIADNLTAELQAELDTSASGIGGEGYEYVLDDITILEWADDTNETLDTFERLIFDSFGFVEGSGIPLFLPKDTDIGLVADEAKDMLNEELLKNHITYLGGVNGLLEQLGIDLIVSEKEAYVAWNTDSPKDIFGAVLDAGKIIGVDFLNQQIDNKTDWDFTLVDESLYAGVEAGIKWDSEGILENMHFEIEAGVDTVPVSVLGVKVVVDISAGAVATLSNKYTGKPTNPKVYAPNVDENWGVTEGIKTEFTSGFDFDIELPQAVWDFADETLTEMLNGTFINGTEIILNEGDEFDTELFYDSIIDNVPRVINIESYITDMFNVEVADNETFDILVSQYRAKLPGEASYRPPLTLVKDVYDGIVDSLDSGLPGPLADNITNFLNNFEEMVMGMADLGDFDVNLIDIATQVVPSVPYYWGTGGNEGTDVPSFANELGFYGGSWLELLTGLYASPSTLYIPKDTNLKTAYQGGIDYLVNLTLIEEGEFEEFRENISIDRFEVEEKSIYLEWEVDGLNDIFWETVGGADAINNLCEMFKGFFDVELDNESIYLSMTATVRYDDEGILDNLHFQVGAEIATNTSEKISFAYETDLSQGGWKKINERFYGEPLIKIYNHWDDPDDQFTLYFGAGSNQELIVESEEYDVEVTFGYSATSDGTLSVQVWTENPSDGATNFTSGALYFAVDVSDAGALSMPITIEVELPADVLALLDEEILEYFQIFTLDESTDEWVFENFTKTIDRVAGTITIEIDHLSVFAAGFIAPPEVIDDDGGFKIPGYTPLFVLFASLGAITLIIKKRK